METKKIVKSRYNRQLCGVCGGFAEYFNVDATLIRLVWVFMIVFAGTGLLAYLIAAIIMPEE